MPDPQSNPAKELREFAVAAWAEPLIRIGLGLFAVQILCLGVLTIYHYASPSDLPEDASISQIWRAFPEWERRVVVALGAAFVVTFILIGMGGVRMNRRVWARYADSDGGAP